MGFLVGSYLPQVLAFYGGIKIARTAYASDYKMRLDEHTDIDIPGVRGQW